MAAKWTILVYLAGDNNLEDWGKRDLAEMKAVGSTADVHVVAQFDHMRDGATRRFLLTRDRSLDDDVVAELGETNTGDPDVLLEFVAWGLDQYPAEHTALILWNHGAGWKDDDVYAQAQRAGVAEADLPRSLVRGVSQRAISRSLFATSIQTICQYPASVRAILFDDTSKDFLDNRELKTVLDRILLKRGGHKLDLLGFDACLMNMIEVAAQVQHACHYMVGSQEIEPGDGWSYHALLRALVRNPDMGAEAFSGTIVDTYIDRFSAFPTYTPVTQASVRMQHVAPLVEAIGRLANSLIAALDNGAFYTQTLLPVLRQVQTFRDQQYVDLWHLAHLLATHATSDQIRKGAQAVMERLDPAAAGAAVVVARSLEAHGAVPSTPVDGRHGRPIATVAVPSIVAARGLSIYVPLLGAVSPAYAGLEFARQCTWGQFLHEFAAS
jgi:hypothetical protein